MLSGGKAADLGTWIQRYPEFKEELTDFVVAHGPMDSLPAAPDAMGSPETELAMRRQTLLQRMLANVSVEPQAAHSDFAGRSPIARRGPRATCWPTRAEDSGAAEAGSVIAPFRQDPGRVAA